jgi:predicted ATP-grasp superfamily ATP-dependent carboligase
MRALNQIDETRKALDSKVDKDDLHGQLQEIKNSIQENGRASERRQNDISRRIDDLMTTVVTGRPPARGNAS